MHNLNRKHLAIVLITAGVVRTGFLLWSWSGWYFMPQSTLSHIYFQQGYSMAAGYGYVLGESEKGQTVLGELHRRVREDNIRALPQSAEPLSNHDLRPEVAHPPGMAVLIAALHRIFGTRADVPFQLFAVVLDTAAAGIFWWIVAAFFSARVALVAGLLYALFPPLAAYAVAKEAEGMLSFFVVASLACVLKATTKQGWNAALWNVLAGLCIGLGGYLRPDYILVPVVMFFGLWAYTRRLWRSVEAVGVMQAVVLLVLLPWAYRNYNVCDRWIFTSTMVGAVLITGLGEFQNPWGFGALDRDRISQAKAQGIPIPWHCEGDLYFRSLFFKSIQERPDAYAMAIVKRLPVIFATPYDFNFQNPLKTTTFSEARKTGEDQYQVLMRRPWYVLAAYWDYLLMSGFAVLCFLATLMMAFKERAQVGLILLLVSPHLYSIGTHILTHMEPRFLLPSMFGLFVGPAYLMTRQRRDFPHLGEATGALRQAAGSVL